MPETNAPEPEQKTGIPISVISPMHVRIGAIVATVMVVVATLVMLALYPDTWRQVLGFTGPTVTGLLVLARLEEYHGAANSNYVALLKLTAVNARLEGMLEERKNPGGIPVVTVIPAG